MKKFHLLFAASFILTGAIVSLFSISLQPPKIDLNSTIEQTEYTLNDIYSPLIDDTDIITYPTVQTHPASSKYPFIMLKEKVDLFQEKRDRLFFATKRIAELKEWSDTYEVLKVVNFDDKTSAMKQLDYWYRTDLENNKFFSKNYTTWESTLMRYFELISAFEEEIGNYDNNKKLITINKLNTQLVADRATLDRIIKKSSLADFEKSYLEDVVNALFKTLLKNSTASVNFDPARLTFSLEKIHNERTYGIYEMTAIVETQIKDSPMEITFNNSKLLPIRTLNTFTGNVSSIIFPPIDIRQSQQEIIFDLPNLQPITALPWKKISANKDTKHLYEAVIPVYKNNYTYLINFDFQINQPAVLSVEQFEKNARKPDTTLILQNDLLPSRTIQKYQRLISLPKDKNRYTARFLLSTSESLDSDNVTFGQISLTPYTKPQLSLSLLDYHKDKKPDVHLIDGFATKRLILKNTNEIQDSYINFMLGWIWGKAGTKIIDNSSYEITIYNRLLYMAVVMTVMGFTYLLTYLSGVLNKFKKAVLHVITILSVKVLRLTKAINKIFIEKFVLKIRFILFAFVFIGIVLQVFVLSKPLDILTNSIIIGTIFTYIAYRPESSVNFVIGTVLFLFDLVLLLQNNFETAELVATWVYIFILLGILHVIFEHFFKPSQTITHSAFFREIILSDFFKTTKKIIVAFSKMPYLLLRKAFYIVSTYFNFKPTTFGQHLSNIVKFFTLAFLLFFSFYILKFCFTLTVNGLTYLVDWQDRETHKAIVKNAEPLIVYHSTKVIITGSRFEWKESREVQLIRGNEEVQTDLWTSSKIIFTVPLHWPLGENILFITKPIFKRGQKTTINSTPIKLKIIPRGSQFTPDDDEFFEQLKHLSDEALELNGYETREEKKK